MSTEALYDYEQVLLGNKQGVSPYFFSSASAFQNEKVALCIIRYAVERFLKWTPEETYRNFGEETIRMMKLESVMNYLIFPPETIPTDYFIISYKLYPNIIKLDMRAMCVTTFKRILSGELAKFPKQFFAGHVGEIRALICLQQVITQERFFPSIDEMYKVFASGEGVEILKKYKLYNASNYLYEFPIDFLHAVLPPEEKNEDLYKRYRDKLVATRLQRQKKLNT